jgi:glycosyltransferase involved in cell wall biosynthesis
MTFGFLINTCEPFYRGGYERRAWAFARELVRQGHEVRIYTSCPKDEIIDGVRFIRLGPKWSFFNRRGVRNGWSDAIFALGILKLLWKVRAKELAVLDVCATPFLHLPIVALISRLKKIPVVLTCHEALLGSFADYVRERGHEKPLPSQILIRALTHVYRYGMGLFPRRLSVSKRTATALEAEGFPTKGVVEFGLEPEAFNPQAPEARPGSEPARFVFCGRLMALKNVELAVTVFLRFRWEGKSFHFDVIGDGSEKFRLEKMVEAAGAKPGGGTITFHGEVSEERKRNLLAAGEIFVLSSAREGFSIATLEAMAQGCGAVVIDNPRLPNGALDIVHPDEEGLCVGPGSEPIRVALEKLMQDPALRLKLRRGAWNSSRNYKIDEQTRLLLAFYQDSKTVSVPAAVVPEAKVGQPISAAKA